MRLSFPPFDHKHLFAVPNVEQTLLWPVPDRQGPVSIHGDSSKTVGKRRSLPNASMPPRDHASVLRERPSLLLTFDIGAFRISAETFAAVSSSSSQLPGV